MLNIMINDSDINILIISHPQTFNNSFGSECNDVSKEGEVRGGWVTRVTAYAKIGPCI